jgi:hypothetical protein
MMTAIRSKATQGIQMDSMRRTALVAGIFYLLTFISIPTLALYGSVHDADYIVGAGPDTAVIAGGILEILVALAGIGTAVALYPVVKRQNEAMALGLVASRVLEAAAMFVGVASLLSIVALRQDGVGTDAMVTGQALAAFYDSMFRISQGFIPAVNALLLGSLLYRSRLVPRVLPTLGFIGAVLLVTSGAGSLFGLWGQMSAITAIATLPIAVWEFGLGLWLTFKGFNTSATVIMSGPAHIETTVPLAIHPA